MTDTIKILACCFFVNLITDQCYKINTLLVLLEMHKTCFQMNKFNLLSTK